jgi:hypothetical protein
MKKIIEIALNCIISVLYAIQLWISIIMSLIEWDGRYIRYMPEGDFIWNRKKHDDKQQAIKDREKSNIIDEFINKCYKNPQLNKPMYDLYNDMHEIYGQQSLKSLLTEIKEK